MRIRISAQPIGPLRILPELPDARLAVLEGHAQDEVGTAGIGLGQVAVPRGREIVDGEIGQAR